MESSRLPVDVKSEEVGGVVVVRLGAEEALLDLETVGGCSEVDVHLVEEVLDGLLGDVVFGLLEGFLPQKLRVETEAA